MKNLIFTFMILAMFSCTEEVAQNLGSASGQSGTGSTNQTTTSLAMRLVNKKVSDDYSYIMHKEGSLDEACELVAPSGGWQASTYTKDDSNTAVLNCVLDAQELDIYFHGAHFELQVDNKACEYIEYRPYKFYQYQPGTSSKEIYKVKCDAYCAAADSHNGYSLCGNTYETHDGLAAFSATSFQNQIEEKAYCNFDYSENGEFSQKPNCDSGQTTVKSYNLTGFALGSCNYATRLNQDDCVAVGSWDGAACNDLPVGAAARSTMEDCTTAGTWTEVPQCNYGDGAIAEDPDAESELSCGGDDFACLAGPGSEIGDTKDINHVITSIESSDYSKEYEIASPFSKNYYSNMYVANFSRICADPGVDKSSDAVFNPTGIASVINIDGKGVEEIAPFSFTDWDGVANNSIDVDASVNGNTDYTIRAYHPFLGDADSKFYKNVRYTTKPYYGFYCLDEARDIKAQIRLYIREWDKTFSASDFALTQVSDFYLSGANTSNMDNANTQDGDSPWNDFRDWDDFYTNNSVYTNNECSVSDLANDPTSGVLVDQQNSKNNFPGIGL
ncbi:MAG: hypothetical protein N4A33_01185 [Bacteriovoracaceae bacterium]|jgi:hypothetical protein|nr:hypothetical protein [Bacteriovoracaceae bacterium]